MATITFKALGVPNVFRDRTELRSWLSSVVREHGLAVNALAFVLMSDEALLVFNQRYLGHDEYTDVITFDGQTGTGVSGDVLISYDRVRENAKRFGVPVQNELRRVMVHGLLHLLGHGDKTPKAKASMRSMEDAWLARLRHR